MNSGDKLKAATHDCLSGLRDQRFHSFYPNCVHPLFCVRVTLPSLATPLPEVVFDSFDEGKEGAVAAAVMGQRYHEREGQPSQTMGRSVC